MKGRKKEAAITEDSFEEKQEEEEEKEEEEVKTEVEETYTLPEIPHTLLSGKSPAPTGVHTWRVALLKGTFVSLSTLLTQVFICLSVVATVGRV